MPLYEIKKTEPKVAVGATATASLTIATKDGWHLNAEAPITVALTPPAGVTLTKAKLTRADLAAEHRDAARFDIAFVGDRDRARRRSPPRRASCSARSRPASR